MKMLTRLAHVCIRVAPWCARLMLTLLASLRGTGIEREVPQRMYLSRSQWLCPSTAQSHLSVKSVDSEGQGSHDVNRGALAPAGNAPRTARWICGCRMQASFRSDTSQSKWAHSLDNRADFPHLPSRGSRSASSVRASASAISNRAPPKCRGCEEVLLLTLVLSGGSA
jgi:hypothetical protein